MKLKFLWFLLISLATIPASAQEVIPITRFGAIPNSQTDVMPAVKQALEYCKDKSDIVISFPEDAMISGLPAMQTRLTVPDSTCKR